MIPEPPDWALRWCVLYLRHIVTWLLWGLVVAHATIYVILRIQRRNPELPTAAALRRFICSKVSFWFLLAIAPASGGGAIPSPWWIIADTIVITVITVTTYWLLLVFIWYYIVPAFRDDKPDHPPIEDVLPEQKGWDGKERRVHERRANWPPRVGA